MSGVFIFEAVEGQEFQADFKNLSAFGGRRSAVKKTSKKATERVRQWRWLYLNIMQDVNDRTFSMSIKIL